MKMRFVAAMLLVSGMAFMSGCPYDDFGFGGYYEPIPDGTYFGTVTASAEYWQNGQRLEQGSSSTAAAATFMNGTVLTPSGQPLQVGDWNDVDLGGLWLEREVYYIEPFDGGFQVSYDLYTEIDGAPMDGVEFVTFSMNGDGSVTYFDTMELTSWDEFDGGQTTLHLNVAGTLAPSQAPVSPSVPKLPSAPLDDDILNRKSR